MTVEITTSIFLGVCAGIAATVTMDVLGGLSRRVGLTVGAKGAWVGRWYLGILRGQLRHANITSSPKLPGEKLAALAGHYAIGIALAILYVVGAAWLGISPGGLFLALGYGLATCVFPWFLVFPSLGFGVLGLRGPSELKMLTSSLINHLSYGFGLWWFAHAFNSLLRVI